MILFVYNNIIFKHKIKFNKYIKKQQNLNMTLFSNIEEFKAFYNLSEVKDNYLLQFILHCIIFNKDKFIFKYLKKCTINNFNKYRYLKYLEYKKINPFDSLSDHSYYLKYGLNYKEYLNNYKKNKANPYDVNYIMERDLLSYEDALIIVNELKQSTSGNIIRYINKYGEEKGNELYNKFCDNSKASLSNFIKLFGKIEGTKKYFEINKKKSFSNSLEGYIAKYGEIEGSKKYKTICNSKGKTLKYYIEKYGEEKGNKFYNKIIEKKIYSLSLEGFIQKYGEEKGLLKHKEYNLKKSVPITKASKQSLNIIFLNLYKYLIENDYSLNDIHFGYLNHNEYHLYSQQYKINCFYDFTILSKKLIIEFHGCKYHPNKEKLTKLEWENWKSLFNKDSADKVFKRDQLKKQIALNAGFNYKIIWSNEDNKNILQDIIKEYNL